MQWQLDTEQARFGQGDLKLVLTYDEPVQCLHLTVQRLPVKSPAASEAVGGGHTAFSFKTETGSAALRTEKREPPVLGDSLFWAAGAGMSVLLFAALAAQAVAAQGGLKLGLFLGGLAQQGGDRGGAPLLIQRHQHQIGGVDALAVAG